MRFFRYLIDKTKLNSHIYLFYVLLSIFIANSLFTIFKFDEIIGDKEKIFSFVGGYRFYLFLLVNSIFHSYFSGGFYYTIINDEEVSFKVYFSKSWYYFFRIFLFSLILIFLMFMMFYPVGISKSFFTAIWFILIAVLSLYISIKLAFVVIYIIKFDLDLKNAIKKSFSTIKGQIFWIIAIISFLKYFFERNIILVAFIEFIYVFIVYHLFILYEEYENFNTTQLS